MATDQIIQKTNAQYNNKQNKTTSACTQYIFNNGAEIVATQDGHILATKAKPSQSKYASLGIDRFVQGTAPTKDLNLAADLISESPQPQEYLVIADKKGKELSVTPMPISEINKNFYLPTD